MAPTLAEFVYAATLNTTPTANKSHNLDELKSEVPNITADISPMALQPVSTDTLRLDRLRMQPAGAHTQRFM
jgi:hypothetical protein